MWDETHLVFADIRSPGTVANLRVNSSVEINVVDAFARKGYRFNGTAELLTAGELFDRILSFYQSRWTDTAKAKLEPLVRSFVLVDVESAFPLISPTYDDGTDESRIRATWVAYFKALNEPSPS